MEKQPFTGYSAKIINSYSSMKGKDFVLDFSSTGLKKET